MKKKLGGYQILDLTSIEIEELEDYTTITDVDVLQTLKEYLLPIVLDPTKELKPIYLRAISGSGRSTVLCELSQYDAVTFFIVAKLSGGTLRIGVGFEQDEETLEWDITSGWQYLTEQTQIEGGAISTIKAIETGTIKDVIGLDEDGEPVKSDSLDISSLKADEIIENMSGYSFALAEPANYILEKVYIGAVKNGNKLTFVIACNITKQSGGSHNPTIGTFTIPSDIGAKLYETQVGAHNFLDNKVIKAFSSQSSSVDVPCYLDKYSNTSITIVIASSDNLVENTKYYLRYEATFLLSDSL